MCPVLLTQRRRLAFEDGAPDRDVLEVAGRRLERVGLQHREVGFLAGADAADLMLHAEDVGGVDGDRAHRLFDGQPLLRRHDRAALAQPVDRDPGRGQRQRRRHGEIGVQGKRDVVPGHGAQPRDLRRPIIAETVLVIGVGQFVDIVDVGGDQCAEIGDPAHLFRGRNAEMLDGEAVVHPRPLELQLLQHVERQLQAHIAGAVDMDAETLVPEGAGQRLDLLRRHQPFAVVAVDEAGLLELHQLGIEAAVGEQLDAVAELQPVGAARRHRPDPRDFGLFRAGCGAAIKVRIPDRRNTRSTVRASTDRKGYTLVNIDFGLRYLVTVCRATFCDLKYS